MSGLLGIFNTEDRDVFPLIYYGLYALQHRGQAAVGIGTIDGQGQTEVHKDAGLISENFGKGLISHMNGNKGVGFVKYKFRNESLPPMPVVREDALLAIDGLIESKDFNMDECLDVLEGPISQIQPYFEKVHGKFAMVYMNSERFIALKNKDGIKPLSIGKYGRATIASSETSAIDTIGGTIIRELQAGELFVQTAESSFSLYLTNSMEPTENLDAFEFIYTARPDSILDGVSVYQARYRLGEALWQEDDLEDAVVIGAPDSGIIASMGYANASKLPYAEGFVRNRYVGRTFIQSTQLDRERGLQIKLTPIKQNVANRNLVLVDDSIVRGTTIKRTVRSLKEMGANAVHVRIASPAIVHDETVTIDIPDQSELIAVNHSIDEMVELIGCDSLRYLSIEGFHRAIGRNQMYEPYFERN